MGCGLQGALAEQGVFVDEGGLERELRDEMRERARAQLLGGQAGEASPCAPLPPLGCNLSAALLGQVAHDDDAAAYDAERTERVLSVSSGCAAEDTLSCERAGVVVMRTPPTPTRAPSRKQQAVEGWLALKDKARQNERRLEYLQSKDARWVPACIMTLCAAAIPCTCYVHSKDEACTSACTMYMTFVPDVCRGWLRFLGARVNVQACTFVVYCAHAFVVDTPFES